MKRIPRALIGFPKVYEAWTWKRENPGRTAYDLGRAVCGRGAEGWRLNKVMEERGVDPDDVVAIHPLINVSEIVKIKLYTYLFDLQHKYGVPTLTTLAEMSEALGSPRETISSRLRDLRKKGVIHYNGTWRGIELERVDYPLHTVPS